MLRGFQLQYLKLGLTLIKKGYCGGGESLIYKAITHFSNLPLNSQQEIVPLLLDSMCKEEKLEKDPSSFSFFFIHLFLAIADHPLDPVPQEPNLWVDKNEEIATNKIFETEAIMCEYLAPQINEIANQSQSDLNSVRPVDLPIRFRRAKNPQFFFDSMVSLLDKLMVLNNLEKDRAKRFFSLFVYKNLMLLLQNFGECDKNQRIEGLVFSFFFSPLADSVKFYESHRKDCKELYQVAKEKKILKNSMGCFRMRVFLQIEEVPEVFSLPVQRILSLDVLQQILRFKPLSAFFHAVDIFYGLRVDILNETFFQKECYQRFMQDVLKVPFKKFLANMHDQSSECYLYTSFSSLLLKNPRLIMSGKAPSWKKFAISICETWFEELVKLSQRGDSIEKVVLLHMRIFAIDAVKNNLYEEDLEVYLKRIDFIADMIIKFIERMSLSLHPDESKKLLAEMSVFPIFETFKTRNKLLQQQRLRILDNWLAFEMKFSKAEDKAIFEEAEK